MTPYLIQYESLFNEDKGYLLIYAESAELAIARATFEYGNGFKYTSNTIF